MLLVCMLLQKVHDCVTSKIAEMKLKLKKRAIPGHDHFGLKNSKIAKILEKLPGVYLRVWC